MYYSCIRHQTRVATISAIAAQNMTISFYALGDNRLAVLYLETIDHAIFKSVKENLTKQDHKKINTFFQLTRNPDCYNIRRKKYTDANLGFRLMKLYVDNKVQLGVFA